MLSSSSDLQRSSLRIAHDGEFYRRLLSREASSAAVPSFRACDGANCAVPFIWESRPGTPKHSSCQAAALPPLTPPPSYQSSPMRGAGIAGKHTSKAGLFLGALLLRLARIRKPRAAPTSSSIQASSAPLSFSPVGPCGHHGCFSRVVNPASPFSRTGDDGGTDVGTSRTSTPCFGMRHGRRGCARVAIRKNAFNLPWM